MDIATLEKGKVERGDPLAQGRFIPFSSKGVNVSDRSITIIGSTINLDRDGEVILPSAYAATLPKFLASNAPFLAAHTHRAADGTPTQVGWVLAGKISEEAVEFLVRFAQTDLAGEWWKLASDPAGKGIAASVGFYPQEWLSGTAKELAEAMPELAAVFARAGLADDAFVRVYTRLELIELSGVPAPSNRESIQTLAAKAFGPEGVKDAAAWQEFAACLAEPLLAEIRTLGYGAALQSEIRNLKSEIQELRTLVEALVPDTFNPAAGGPEDGTSAAGDGDGKDAGDEGKAAEAATAALRGLVEALKASKKPS